MINILLSVRRPWSTLILEGRKKWELRKTTPRAQKGAYVTLWIYENGKDGERAIIGKCRLFTTFKIHSYSWGLAEVVKSACVTEEDLRYYLPCFVWEITHAVRLPHAVPLPSIGLTRPPQSWQYLTPEQSELIESEIEK